MSANEFPLKNRPDPDDFDAEVVEAMAELMCATRVAVAPNPMAQAMYPPMRPHKPKKRS